MKRELGPSLAINGALVFIALSALAPLAWMLSVSLMAPGEASSFPPPLWPSHASLENFRKLFTYAGMGKYFFNSVVLATATTSVTHDDLVARRSADREARERRPQRVRLLQRFREQPDASG